MSDHGAMHYALPVAMSLSPLLLRGVLPEMSKMATALVVVVAIAASSSLLGAEHGTLMGLLTAESMLYPGGPMPQSVLLWLFVYFTTISH